MPINETGVRRAERQETLVLAVYTDDVERSTLVAD